MARMTLTHVSTTLGMETTITVVTPNRTYISAPGDHQPDWPNHPGWNTPGRTDNEGLPGVLYLLHGLNGDHSVWNTYSRLDHLADEHNVMIVCPSGYRSFWINQYRGFRVRDWVTLELPELIADTFHVDTSRDRTYIGGMSMGGYGAVYLAMRAPELYGHVIALSGVLDVNDTVGRRSLPGFYHTSLGGIDPKGSEYDLIASLPDFVERCRDYGAPDFWVSCGTEDTLLPHSKRFSVAARQAGLNVYGNFTAGEHAYAYWTPKLYEAMECLDKH